MKNIPRTFKDYSYVRWRVKQFPDILTPIHTTDTRNAGRLISHMIPVSYSITRSYKTRAKSNFHY